MTKDEYMNQLKNNLQSLTTDEQNEALQYYSDYFDEAGDVEKVISELGSPETLAKTIVEKFANVPVKSAGESESEKEEAEKSFCDDALFYSFQAADIKNLTMNFSGAQIVAIPGDVFSVETRGLTKDNLNCYLSPEGNLSISNDKKVNLSFFSHDRKSRVIPRILLTIPVGFTLNRFKVNLGAGYFETRNVDVKCSEGQFEVGAGKLTLDNVIGGKIDFRCGMGNLNFKGKISGVSNIDCGMGSVKIETSGSESSCSYDVKVGLGEFRLNDIKKSGVCQYFADVRKENHFSVNCGMGNVVITMDK